MAEQRPQDAVNQSLSVGDLSPSDAPARTSTPEINVTGEDAGAVEAAPKENGLHTLATLKMDELDDASARSDTDTSRADGSVAGDKATEQKPLKKFTARPVSFAKYSVPKVIAASAAAKSSEKASTPNSSTSSLTQAGRPRLVAKTTSSLQSTANAYKTATPDPMQVWNKNRVTPQPSTKHLTDEELKQQYGIHLTSRIQADGDGKDPKWADIDDDEDDWAPETIEWNDGTKSTLPPADVVPPPGQKPATPVEASDASQPTALPPKILTPQFASSVGPNATVLKIGRQQAQKAATLQSRSPSEKPSLLSSRPSGASAPPAKSPWASLPPVDKVSPIAINPQMPPSALNRPAGLGGYGPSQAPPAAAPLATEISADDFNRAWRDSASGGPRELFIPNSGRYEAVPEGRRRMSRNDQNFRAPAVLQRPNQSDPHAPAEPSPAFQTHRTSMDQRRRASSTLSGTSGQFARRMSFKSADMAPPVFETHEQHQDTSLRPISRDGSVSQPPAPSYPTRPPNDFPPDGPMPITDADLETQRAQQRALMKENIERARRRKIEEEQRLEAEKQERIRQKLASLGPDPSSGKKPAHDLPLTHESQKDADQPSMPTVTALGMATQSPPKPPLPLASGEPQQYGMMKVHPMDSVKKLGTSLSRPVDQHKPARAKGEVTTADDQADNSTSANGSRMIPELRKAGGQDHALSSEPSPKLPKHSSTGNDARSGWADMRHGPRSPQATTNLWGLPNNKALGNGTFDQGLAGYAPQDLSRTSSTAQGWMNGRTPHPGRSPQVQYANHSLADSRSFSSYQPVASPDQGPLAADSEVDSLFPTTKPAPIGPPQVQQAHSTMNGYPNGSRPTGVEAWGNFHQTAAQQERAESERAQRDMMARRDEEMRTGVRPGPAYSFNETWKQVSVGDQAGQRQTTNVSQSTAPPSNAFGAVGSVPADTSTRLASVPGRGSRFFPPAVGAPSPQDRRAVTISHPEPPRTPSPPPAEDYTSFHPAFDGDLGRPVVHFPREKAVVKLPPDLPPTPPSPVHVQNATSTNAPLSWAARVSQTPQPSGAALRAVSTPIAPSSSWQERFNGLLGKKTGARESGPAPATVLAVASSTREPLDLQHVPAASVSLPAAAAFASDMAGDGSFATKDVENEDDLFEDREPGSLPAVLLPVDGPLLPWGLSPLPNGVPALVDAVTAFPLSFVGQSDRPGHERPPFALIRFPDSTKTVRKELSAKGSPASPIHRGRHRFGGSAPPSGSLGAKHARGRGGPRSRHASKAH